MQGDIVGEQIRRGTHGLSDAHFPYTAAVERQYSVDYQASGASITRSIASGTLSEDMQVMRWEAHGVAGASGNVSVTFGGSTLITMAVGAGQAFSVWGELTRLAAASEDSIAHGLAAPTTVNVTSATPAVNLAVSQNLVVSMSGVGGVVNLLRVGLSGAP